MIFFDKKYAVKLFLALCSGSLMMLNIELRMKCKNYIIFCLNLSLIGLNFTTAVNGQETNTKLSGVVRNEKKEILDGTTLTLVDVLTENTFTSKTNAAGYFYFFNLRPGGPYSLTITHIAYATLKKEQLFIDYSPIQDNNFSEYVLLQKTIDLPELIVTAKKNVESKIGIETNITNQQINAMPSISRNLQDYVRLVPQAKVNDDGGISLAGQNNKFNAFFIDGASNNDMLGLAPSGINGGQAASPPVSIEAIEEIKVSLSPYDVQYSNFTGGSINAITRSGSNENKSSA